MNHKDIMWFKREIGKVIDGLNVSLPIDEFVKQSELHWRRQYVGEKWAGRLTNPTEAKTNGYVFSLHYYSEWDEEKEEWIPGWIFYVEIGLGGRKLINKNT